MQKNIENQSFLLLLVSITLAFLWVLKPFFGPVFWAVAIAIIFAPVHNWFHNKLPGHANLNAVLTLLICLVIVIIPVVFTISSVVAQIVDVYERVRSEEVDIQEYVEKVESAFPVLQNWMERFNLSFESAKQSASAGVMAAGKTVAQNSLSVGQNTFGFLLDVGVMLYVAFFFLRDGKKILSLLYKALPLGDHREKLLFQKFAEVTRATVKGNLVVATVQGTIGGVTFALLGIPAPMIWGVVMICASFLPAVGAGIVWVPVAIYLLATGSYLKAITLIAVGALVIGLIDNVLRPILVGRDTKLPDYIVLLSTLGGLVLFGINGFVIGPLIAAMFIAFWGIFVREFQDDNHNFRSNNF